MIRLATRADIPRILEIRDNPGAEPLTDPSRVTVAEAERLIADIALWVWQETNGLGGGFAGVDRRAGAIWALLVAAGQEGKGIGRALLTTCCDALRQEGHAAATITLEPGSLAERYYRTAGWTEASVGAAVRTFRKPL